MTAVAVAKCPYCGGRLDPGTNGNGGVVDRCSSCGREPPRLVPPGAVKAPAAAPAAPPRAALRPAGSVCPVEGCPGALDDSGQCACCAKRAAWLVANTPMRTCAICEGKFPVGRALKYCPACVGLKHKKVAASATAATPVRPPKSCKDCGKSFQPTGPASKYCPVCRKAHT